MKHFFLLILAGLLLLACGAAAADEARWTVTTPEDAPWLVTSPVLNEKIDEALTRVGEGGETPRRLLEERIITLTKGERTERVYYDDLYGETWLVTGEEPVLLEGGLGPALAFPFRLWVEETSLDFDGAAAYEDFLAPWGWTPSFVISRQTFLLPEKLTASRTDAADLYFTWVRLFLQDAGYDLTPYLGQEVDVVILGLWESVPRSTFVPEDEENGIRLPVSLRCIVLEQEGEIIGAYLSAGRHDCTWKLSLKGGRPLDLLGTDDPTDYLLSRAELTDEDTALAVLTPEEMIRAYFADGGPANRYAPRSLLLAQRCANMPDNMLFVPYGEEFPFDREPETTPVPWGEIEDLEPMPNDPDVWHVRFAGGSERYVKLVHESDATGWKIRWCYDFY